PTASLERSSRIGMPAEPVDHFHRTLCSFCTFLSPVVKTGLWSGGARRLRGCRLQNRRRLSDRDPARKYAAALVAKKKKGTRCRRQRVYVLMMQRTWRKSFAG